MRCSLLKNQATLSLIVVYFTDFYVKFQPKPIFLCEL